MKISINNFLCHDVFSRTHKNRQTQEFKDTRICERKRDTLQYTEI